MNIITQLPNSMLGMQLVSYTADIHIYELPDLFCPFILQSKMRTYIFNKMQAILLQMHATLIDD